MASGDGVLTRGRIMGIVVRSGAVAAVAAVTGATLMAIPVERSKPLAGGTNSWSTSVNLTASSATLHPLGLVLTPKPGPRISAESNAVVGAETSAGKTDDLVGAELRAAVAGAIADETGIPTEEVGGRGASAPMAAAAEDPAVVADQIDDEFIAFRRDVRTEFHEFANQFGYLGKQMYIAFNFGESILASAIFNGTDIMRGEGLFENLGEFAFDVALSAVYVVVDQLYLAIPGLPPIVALPERPPLDRPLDWRRPLPPQPGRDLVVPFDPVPETSQALAAREPDNTGDESVPDEDAGAEDSSTNVTAEHDQSDALPADEESKTDEGSDAGEESEIQKHSEVQQENEAAEGDGSEPREKRGFRLGGAEKRAKGDIRQADTSSDERGSAPSENSDSNTEKSARKSAPEN